MGQLYRNPLDVLLGVVLFLLAEPASGGGGPENVLLVVNSASQDSVELADYYQKLRKIPPGNVFSIAWGGSRESLPVEEFRRKLLIPILREIDNRKLSAQIDYVIYSCDFPWRINLRGDFKEAKLGKVQSPIASLTGATFLYQFVQGRSRSIVGLRTNWYMKAENNLERCQSLSLAPSQGFRSRYRWRSDQDQPLLTQSDNSKPALRYLLSTMLAVTAGRGNSIEEAKSYLKRSVFADVSTPQGTFYFVQNRTPRSRPRHACYASVVEALQGLGAKAELLQGSAPKNVDDALGLMLGTSAYDLAKFRVKLQPGAIGDNLTSFGGVMFANASQTPLSAMLRQGAAGASGTVFEPTAVQAKFALPSLMLHYRRGCSLAESYYQCVASPYQLLIVGDPLCQPWANRPAVDVPGFVAGQVVSKALIVRPHIRSQTTSSPPFWELFIDGHLVARAPSGAAFRYDPASLKPGTHEIRVVAFSADSIESQARWISNFTMPETDKTTPAAPTPEDTPPTGSRTTDSGNASRPLRQGN